MSETGDAISHELVEFHSSGLVLRGERWTPRQSRGQVIFLHGGGQTRHSWGQGAQLVARDGWTAIVLDLRGHGDSQWSPQLDYDVAHHAADVAAVCREIGGSFVVVGASLGGVTAIWMTADAPELVDGLILVDIVPRPDPVGIERIRAFMTAHLDGFADLDEVAAAVASYTHRDRPRSDEGLRKNVRLHDDGRWYWHWDPAVIGVGRTEEARPGVEGDELLARAGAIRAPLLLVRGAVSDVVDDRGQQELLDAVPHARAIVVPDAGHMVAGDNNDVFAAAVLGFLDEVVGG